MAAPITHLVLAQRFLKNYRHTFVPDQFLIGTSFPDIRYLKVINRRETHKDQPVLADVQTAKSSFLAGMYFHALVDKIRSYLFAQSEIWSVCPDTLVSVRALKMIEDEYLWAELKDQAQILTSFEHVVPQERLFPITDSDIVRWHTILQHYIEEGQTIAGQKLFMESLSLPDSMIEEIAAAAAALRVNKQVLQIIQGVYEQFSFEL